jgi:hypothetical protein
MNYFYDVGYWGKIRNLTFPEFVCFNVEESDLESGLMRPVDHL